MISYQKLNQQPIRIVSSAIRHVHDDLKIELENKEIVLLDQGNGTTAKPLKGTIKFTPDKSMNVRSISLLFYGKMRVSWIEGTSHNRHHYKQEKQLIQHKWHFVPHDDQTTCKKVYTFSPGVHSFDFELQLPVNLPQSLETEGGQISYRLRAVVERTGFQHKIVKKEDIQIIRCMLPSELELERTLEIHNTWAELMRYDIQLPSKVYSCGSSVPVNFQIAPLTSNFKVRYVSGTLKEFCTYTTDECSKEDVRIIQQLKIDNPFANMVVWSKDLELDIPSLRSRHILCDADSDLIRIRHKLEFIIALHTLNGQFSELRCSVPVIIVCSTCHNAERSSLPTYAQSSNSALCMATPVDNSDSSWWNGINLSRVPSYKTVATSHIDTSTLQSLPDYDQLSISSRSSQNVV